MDQTLLRFDVALGEGVARLGFCSGEAERSMDDLIERTGTWLAAVDGNKNGCLSQHTPFQSRSTTH